MIIKNGSIPENINSISFRNIRFLRIKEDAINLPRLTNFTVSDSKILHIEHNGMAYRKTELYNILFEKIGLIEIYSNAFTGFWLDTTTINMKNIHSLYINENAFNYKTLKKEISTGPSFPPVGPSIFLTNIKDLQNGPNGIQADTYMIELNNVFIYKCPSGSFGRSYYAIKWNNVTADNIYDGCFYGKNLASGKTSIEMNNVKIKTLHTNGIVGEFKSVYIKDTTIETIETGGIKGNTSRFYSYNLSINLINTEAFQMQIDDSFSMEKTSIQVLKRNAFFGIKSTEYNFFFTIRIEFMQISHPENGSLTFDECNRISLGAIYFTSLLPDICPTPYWVWMLYNGNEEKNRLNQGQYELFYVLLKLHRCKDEVYPDEFVPKCLEDDTTATGEKPTTEKPTTTVKPKTKYPTSEKPTSAIEKQTTTKVPRTKYHSSNKMFWPMQNYINLVLTLTPIILALIIIIMCIDNLKLRFKLDKYEQDGLKEENMKNEYEKQCPWKGKKFKGCYYMSLPNYDLKV